MNLYLLIRLYLIILIEGFVLVSMEIISIRQLLPFVGNNVVITSLIIGTVLLFLALGYQRGGKVTENYYTVLKRNFSVAALWLGVGFSYLFIDYFFFGFRSVVSQHPLVILSFYLLIIASPLVYVLGQTLPITTNLFRQEAHVGAISGKALFISTLGSFGGAVLTSVLLLHFLGVAWTIVINAGLLVLLALMLIDSMIDELLRIVVLLVGLSFVYTLNVGFEQSWFVRTTNYANYKIMPQYKLNNKQKVKALVVNNSLSSYLKDDNTAALYIERIKQLLFTELALRNKNILVLGAGGFTLTAQSDFKNNITYVDIDSVIKKVVTKNFLAKINGEFIAADARIFMKTTPRKFSAVVSDVFNSRSTIPGYLLTQEHLHNIHRVLLDDGYAVFNIISRPFLNDKYSKRVDNTIRSVFHNCMVMPLLYSKAVSNIIYICQKHANEQDDMVYTDNLNQATMDFFTLLHRGDQ